MPIPTFPLDVLSCFDPLGNATHTALSFDLIGEDVLITGAGPIGCMAVAICRHAGARNVVITDINPYRLDLARKMAPNVFAVDVRDHSLGEAMQELGMKEGFDVALEMSGSPKAFNDLLPNMFHGGKIALFGIMPDKAAIDWNTVVFSALTIKGIYGREMYETWYKMTAMIQSGLDISPVITHRFPYTQFKEGIELMKSGNSGKIVLDWSRIVILSRDKQRRPSYMRAMLPRHEKTPIATVRSFAPKAFGAQDDNASGSQRLNPDGRVLYCFEIAGLPRRTYFWTLPVAVFGSSERKVIPCGALKCAR